MSDRASPEEAVGLAWAEPRIEGSPMDGTRLRRRHPACCGAPDRTRTCDLWVRNPTLYPLSYRRAS